MDEPTPVESPVKGYEQKPSPTMPDVPIKEKNPRRVAAGKKLAEYNKRQKKQLGELVHREAEREQQIPQPKKENFNYTPIYFAIPVLLAGIGSYAYTKYKPTIWSTTWPKKFKKVQKPLHTWD